MVKKSLELMIKLNKKLKNNNQKLKLTYYTTNKIIFNNGVILTDFNEINTFKQRLKNELFLPYIDILYGNDKKLSEETLKKLKIDSIENKIKKRNLKFMNNLNNTLKLNNQKLSIIKYSSDKIIFNNGLILNDFNEMNTFKQRTKLKTYINYMDIIYGNDKKLSEETLKKLKSDSCKKGGYVCWEKYKNKFFTTKGRTPWNKGTKGLQPPPWNKGLTKETDKRLKIISENMTGKGNPMYGIDYPEEIKLKQSKIVKEKILKGEWTPNIHNSNTTFDIFWNNNKYRSSWEAMFHQLNPNLKYEKLRVEYFLNNKKHIYITDFIDEENKIVYEIKPKIHKKTLKWEAKEKSILNWCKENNHKFYFIDEWYFYENWNKIKLNELDKKSQENARKMYETCKKRRNKKTK